jgi:hypothetical protein
MNDRRRGSIISDDDAGLFIHVMIHFCGARDSERTHYVGHDQILLGLLKEREITRSVRSCLSLPEESELTSCALVRSC